MALPSNDINDLNRNSIIESSDVSGQPGIVVLNPDGTAVGAPVGGATSANQTNGSQKTQIVDAGGEVATVTGGKLDVNATASLAGTAIPISGATEAVGVAIVDGSGNQITSFGGGTQYTEDAAAAANPVGTAPILIRTDTPATQVTTDGDNIAQRGTNYGAAYVQLVTSSGSYIDSVGGGTEYTEDVATANPIVGKAIMVERDDALSAVTPIEGDNIGLRGTAEGALWTQDFNSDAILADTTAIKTAVEILDNTVSGSEMQVDIVSSALPTGASTLAEQQSQTTHLSTIAGDTTSIQTSVELIDDTVATLGTTTYTEAATKGLIIGAVRRDADTTLVNTTNEVTPLQVDASGRLKVEAFSGETLPVSLTSTTVTGTVAVTQSGTWDEVGINDSGNSITVDYATTGSGTATGALRVELPTNGTGVVGLNAGTNNIGDVDVASIAAGDNNIGNVDIVSGTITTVTTLTGGGIAHDSGDSGNPLKIGFKAYSPDGTTPGTAVAEGDRTDGKSDLDGRQYVNGEHPRWGSYHVDGSSALTDATVAASPGAGFQTVITNITFSSGAATAINMFLEEGASKIFGPIYLEAVAGRGFCTPAGFRKHVTAATAVTITTSAAIAHSVDIQYETVAV